MLKIIFVIIGTLIGAGFASGREIYLFFTQYGTNGILGIIVSGIITSLIVYKTLIIVNTYEITNYSKFLEKSIRKNKKINKLINYIVNTFLLISFYIMVAGFSGYIKQNWGISIYISSTIFVLLCFIVFKKNINGVVKANEILVPVLIFLIMYIGLKNIPYLIKTGSSIIYKLNNYKESNNWLISSILYTSYNSIILIPVLTGLRKYITGKKQIMKISIISGLIIILLALLIFGLLSRVWVNISQTEMPLVIVSKEFGTIFKYIYGFIIIASIFTSAISTGYSFLKNVSKNKYEYNTILIIMCTSAIFISNIGFSKLVAILYPLFGILGLIQWGRAFLAQFLSQKSPSPLVQFLGHSGQALLKKLKF